MKELKNQVEFVLEKSELLRVLVQDQAIHSFADQAKNRRVRIEILDE